MTLEILGNTNGAHYVQGTHDVQDSTMMVDKVGIMVIYQLGKGAIHSL